MAHGPGPWAKNEHPFQGLLEKESSIVVASTQIEVFSKDSS
jgi:hypothetical protein